MGYNSSSSINRGGVLHWVNSAKGIGIILVIIGHLLYDSRFPNINKYIYSFHMPLFFVLSGFVQKNEIKEDYIKKRTDRLLLPFVLYSVISFLFWGLRKIYATTDVFGVLMDAFYVRGEIYNAPLWFLVVLFEICVIMAITKMPQKTVRRKIIIYIATVISGYLVYIFHESLFVLDFFGINRMVVCLSFYILGMIIKQINIKSNYVRFAIGVLSIALNLVFVHALDVKISLYSLNLGNYFFFQVAAVSGSIATMTICKAFFDKEGLLEWISGYAVLFLGAQYFLIEPFRSIVRRLGITGTIQCDVLIIVIAITLIFAIPILYDWMKERLKYIKLLNGESI